MFGKLDLRGEQPESANLPLLQAYLQQLLGEPVLFLRFSYGEELRLHLGAPREYASARLRGRVKGSYSVGTRASGWYLRSSRNQVLLVANGELPSGGAEVFTPLTAEDIEKDPPIAPDAIVVLARAVPAYAGYDLILGFSDGAMLRITPNAENPEEPLPDGLTEDIADWEIFTPFQRFLRVGPGPKWAYLPSVREEKANAAT